MVEIIILNWNGLEDTQACLYSLARLPNTFHITVIDNGSRNDEARILQAQFPKIKVIDAGQNLGFVGGNNLVLTNRTAYPANYYLLLNNDTVVPAGALENLLSVAEAHTEAGIFGPLIYHFGRPELQSAGAGINLTTGSTALSAWNQVYSPYAVDMVSGCCLLVRDRALEKVGPLEPSYGAYYEETELCLRTRRAGFEVLLVPSSHIEHKGGATSSKVSGFHEYQMSRNRLHFIWRNGNTLQQLSTFLYVTFFYLWARSFKLIVTHQTANLSSLWRGYIAGCQSRFSA